MSQQLPKLLFVGAGNIAQSIMKGLVRARPNDTELILATAPTSKNLTTIKESLECRTALLEEAITDLDSFEPDFVFLCVKPQVLSASLRASEETPLVTLLRSVGRDCVFLSLLAGFKLSEFESHQDLYRPVKRERVVRVMLNTAAEIGSTSVFYYAPDSMEEDRVRKLDELFKLISKSVIRLNSEDLMDVATGVCGSGIAFFYEMIQAFSDVAVTNGLPRKEATLVAAELSKAAGKMLLAKRAHPYQLRDEVASPAGTTIFGLNAWHEQATGAKIGKAVQASIDRAKGLALASARPQCSASRRD